MQIPASIWVSTLLQDSIEPVFRHDMLPYFVIDVLQSALWRVPCGAPHWTK